MKELHRFEDLKLDDVIHDGNVEQIETVEEIPRFELPEYDDTDEYQCDEVPPGEVEFEQVFERTKRKRHHYRINFPNLELLDLD
jgi:hypothetical protein